MTSLVILAWLMLNPNCPLSAPSQKTRVAILAWQSTGESKLAQLHIYLWLVRNHYKYIFLNMNNCIENFTQWCYDAIRLHHESVLVFFQLIFFFLSCSWSRNWKGFPRKLWVSFVHVLLQEVQERLNGKNHYQRNIPYGNNGTTHFSALQVCGQAKTSDYLVGSRWKENRFWKEVPGRPFTQCCVSKAVMIKIGYAYYI